MNFMIYQMKDEAKATSMLFQETGKFVILGLTGRTGSGCSTVSKILSEENFRVPPISKLYQNENDKRKYGIVLRYIGVNWRPFIAIQVRAIITGVLLRLNYDEFVSFVSVVMGSDIGDLINRLSGIEEEYNKAYKIVSDFNLLNDKEEKEEKKEKGLDIYLDFLPRFCDKFKDFLKDNLNEKAYTILYQKIGDNIRASGTANSSEFNENKLFTIPKIIWHLIKAIKLKNHIYGACITIDAIRNPFEAIYFQQRYSSFYLISINTPDEIRTDHLRAEHQLSDQQIEELDSKEYPKKLSGKDIYISQNIQKCIEIADIHINNPVRDNYDNELRSQLAWYISLIIHPGLITPTSNERCMQLAYTAKLNSGCISRQVGAVVTDSNYSVNAVGWNSSPEGQVPCLLRNAKELLCGGDELVYSKYERTDKAFQAVANMSYVHIIEHDNLKGRNVSYCFKDLQNKVDGEKNQVHTRSLHAEENAFLQIAKYGGPGINGGILFSTASPCELCSKKAYQLGIKQIVYIDPYPGISKNHILCVGDKAPEMILFSGAIGHAYHKLYQSVMAYKDELQMLTGLII
jgi:deoxycytidylate deaminase